MTLLSIIKSYKNGVISTEELTSKIKNISQNNDVNYPLSEGQKGLWVIDKVNKGKTSEYNVPISFKISNEVQTDKLKLAARLLLLEYPILNSVIREIEGKPIRKIKEDYSPYFVYEDISQLEEEAVLPYIRKYSKDPIPLNTDNLIRFYLLKRSNNEFIMTINVHHIVFDGSSIVTLLNSLFDKYIQLLSNSEEMIDVKRHTDYSEYVQWEKENLEGERGISNYKFWNSKLVDYKTSIEIPKRYDSIKHYKNGKTLSFSLPNKTSEEIVKYCNHKRINKSTFFLSVFKVLLYQWTGQTDCVVGMPVMQRPHEKFRDSIGYFINMIPVRHKINVKDTFLNLSDNLQAEMIDYINHSDYPFPLIAKSHQKNLGVKSDSLVQVTYSYQNYMKKGTIEKYKNYRDILSIDFLEEIHQEGEYDITLEVFEMEDHFHVRIKYDEVKYGYDIINSFKNNYKRLVQEVLNTQDTISNITKDTMSSYSSLNESSVTSQLDKPVQELFGEVVKRSPNSIAVIDSNNSVTYEKLKEKSDLLAIYLQSIGGGKGNIVGIYIDRSINLVTSLLGVLKSGAAFVPLDPANPQERLSYIIDDSKIKVIITNKELESDLNSKFLNRNLDLVIIDEIDKTIKFEQSHKINEISTDKKDLAYLLYTSGSTGKPKGVMIPHGALTNFLYSMSESPGITERDSLLSVTTFGFDIAFLEIFLPLVNGAKCILASTVITKDAEKLKNLINSVQPTIMQATPATWSLLFKVGWENTFDTKILCGGEPLTKSLKEHFTNYSSEAWNMFGPTETTIWSSIKRIEKDKPITIGKPIANTELFVLDDKMNRVHAGIKGELYISGHGLALGYLNKPELTEQRFKDNPFGEGKIYKTGDAARWTEDGEVEYLGRIDNQVKLNGYRIELEEIETVIEKYPGISRSVVTIVQVDNLQQLRGFFLSDVQNHVELDNLKNYMSNKLPHYMIPSKLIQVETLPLNTNGKVDRYAINKMATNQIYDNKKNEENRNIREVVKSIFEKTLAIELDINAGFFENGGDSVAAVVLVERINDEFAINITSTDIFEHPTINELTKYIEKIVNNKNLTPKIDSGEIIEKGIPAKKENGLENNKYKKSVAIIGVSCKLPGANNHHEFWENLLNGNESIEKIPVDEQKNFISDDILHNKNYVPARSTIDGKAEFDAAFFKISPKEAELMDPQMRLLLMHSWKAVEDAGYYSKEIPDTAVYTSTSNNSYLAGIKDQRGSVVDSSSKYTNWLLAQNGTASTMISYYLGLTGQSLSVHSNCSSSLVGIDLAYKNIISGSTDYALVGASTIHSLKNLGYVHRSGLNFSKDGHIKAFDETANGMIGGEGVAVVLLKNAEKAIQDGDHIYSIIKGVSTNNDGSNKAGFYAPSVKGQSTVIKDAMQEAEVSPESITFIEAHGTGTQLGDPIEFKALKSAFGLGETEKYCALGSVKTNIGHLDTVSGLVGCIKSALSIKHRMLPSTLNFKKPNKQILLEKSPFFIADKTIDFSNYQYPVRAGVSSFGIGGTNCHAVLEEFQYSEYNHQSKGDFEDKEFIIPISAKNKKVLNRYIKNLSNFLKKERPDVHDVAYTMQVGRMQMESRAIFNVKSLSELIYKLDNFKGNDNITQISCLSNNKSTEELVVSWLNGDHINWMEYEQNFESKRISLPTYPFDMKEYWINPEQNSEKKDIKYKLHPFVSENNSSFTSQKYSVDLNEDEYYIKDHVIDNRKILPGVFYVEMARFAGESAIGKSVTSIKNIVWKRPIEVNKSTKVSIELKQSKGKVYFDVYDNNHNKDNSNAQGIIDIRENHKSMPSHDIEKIMRRCKKYYSKDDFYKEGDSSIYQYGESYQTIEKLNYNDNETLAKINMPACCNYEFDKFKLHPSILEGGLQSIVGLMLGGEKSPFMPYSIEEIQILGGTPKECYAYTTCSSMSSSTSKLKKYNIDLCDTHGNVFLKIINYTVGYIDQKKKRNIEEEKILFYKRNWKKENNINTNRKDSNALYISSNINLVDDRLVRVDLSNNSLPNLEYPFKGEKIENLTDIINDEKNNNIVFLLPQKNSNYDLQTNILHITKLLFSFLHSTIKIAGKKKINIIFLYKNQDCAVSAFYDSLNALLNSIRLEHPNLKIKTIKQKGNYSLSRERIESEFNSFSYPEVMFNGSDRFVKLLKKLNYTKDFTNHNMPIKQNGVYIIAGGLGKIGTSLTEYLIKNFNSQVIIISRSHSSISENEKLGKFAANIILLQADISSEKETERIIERISTDFGEINGVFNCCGVISDSLFKNKSINEFTSTINPKILGSINLDNATKDSNLDLFVSFSSVSSLGNIGQTDYSLANEFLNSFADYRMEQVGKGNRSGRTISICWPLWESGSMTVNSAQLKIMERVGGFVPMPTTKGLLALEDIFNLNTNSPYLFYGRPSKMIQSIEKNFIKA